MRTPSHDRLSAHDAGFLVRETAAQPLHYVLQCNLDAGLTVAEVRTHVEARLGALPVLRKRLRYPLLRGRPVWVDDRDFDVARHVVGWPDPLRSDADIARAFTALTVQRLPRDRPLWRLVVGERPGQPTTLWLSVHHALMDGGLLAATLRELFPVDAGPAAATWRPRRGPSRLTLLLRVLARQVLPSRGPTTGAAPTSATPPKTLLAGAVSPARAVAGLTVPLDDLRPARARTGATVNDLFLAAVTAGLRAYLPGWTGEPLPEELLALVPRDVRREEEAGVIGNRGWSMHVPLPIGRPDRDDRIAAIRAATEAGKQLDRTAGAGTFRFDIALTNVRLGGPHAVGRAKVVGYSGAVPLQGENRLVGTALSYLGDLNVTFTADAAAFPDVERLAELTAAGFKELS